MVSALSIAAVVVLSMMSAATMWLVFGHSLIALFLFWMYLMFYILIACGFLNRSLQERSKAGELPV